MIPHSDQQWSVLSAKGVEAIRSAALRTLERVGVRVQDPAIRSLLAEAGATIVEERVFIPAYLTIDSLAKAPREVKLYSKAGQAISSADDRHYHSPAPSAVAVVDHQGNRRISTYSDAVRLTRLADSLGGIDFMTPPVIAQDCPPEHSGVLTAEATFCNTGKFCLAFALNRLEAEAWLAMAGHTTGSPQELARRPCIGFAISPTSPLVLSKEASDILQTAAGVGVPIITVPGGMAGATSPYTIAGTLVVEHAEALVVVTIAQLIRPGTPCLLGLATAVMDMASGSITLGAAERTLILNAVAPLAHAWGLPGYAPVGLTDSFALDEQAGGEKMLSFITQMMSGLEFGSGVGRFEGGLASSYEGMFLDHELLQMARRHLRGCEVSADSLAEEVIAQVGPGGDFLSTDHTLQRLRSNEFTPSMLFNRLSRSSGGQAAAEAAHQRVEALLAQWQPPLAERELTNLKAIVAEYLAQSAQQTSRH